MQDVVITGAKRTPIGGFQGEFSKIAAPALGATAIRAALEDASCAPSTVDEVLMGLVLSAGVGQAPARQANLGAGMPKGVPATTISKVCGSGMKAMCQGFDAIRSGSAQTIIAGGMESMTQSPYLSGDARGGARLGHRQLIDHMFLDGLQDAYEEGALMGVFAERCATKYQLTREVQDAYALTSLSRAITAQDTDAFDREIAPVSVTHKGQTRLVLQDEQPQQARPDKIPLLKPAFAKGGTVTAANASSISDGAAALVLVSRALAEANDMPIRAKIAGWAAHAHDPDWFTTAPIPATQSLLDRLGWTARDVDLWEVNEAFAVVPMVFMQQLGVPHEKLNVNGGACALGHPIGASGARIVVTLLHAMEARDLKRGIAAICIGGGEGLAIAIERD
jgi:acetyl-CoA C-acetyltransferase|tara:strand:- start:7023 stop:8201 length:1179 start_codon:yes stop_codon:yes gene_type:complete